MTIGVVAAREPRSRRLAQPGRRDRSDLRRLGRRVQPLARGLAERGLGPGDRVVICIGPDEPFPWLIAYAAVHRAGAVAVPVNTRLAGPELRRSSPTPSPPPSWPVRPPVAAMPWTELAADVGEASGW